MLTPVVILLLVVMLPFWMAVVSIHRVGLDGEYEPSDMLFCILQLAQSAQVALVVLRAKSASSARYC